MIIDVKSSTISLNTPPEDYIVHYFPEEPENSMAIRSKIILLIEGLLTGEFGDNGSFTSTIIDFFNFRELVKPLGIELKFTQKALDVLKNYLKQCHEVQEIKNGVLNQEINTTLKNTLMSDQKSATAFLLSRGHAGNFSSVGIGKTITALAVFNILKNTHKVSQGLIFILNYTKLGWAEELQKHTDYSYKIVGNGTKKVVKDIEDFDEDLLLVHYDALLSEEVCVALAQKCFDFWIIDEAHVLRNMDVMKRNAKTKQLEPSCKRANAIKELNLATAPNHVIALTATPIGESPMNAYGILKLLKPGILPKRTRFEDHFCNFFMMCPKKGARYKIKVLDKKNPYKNLDQLKSMIQLYSFRTTHEDAKDFPETIYVPKRFELDEAQRVVYNKIADDTFKEIAANPSKALNLEFVMVKTLRLRQFLSSPIILGEDIPSTKFKVLDEMFDELFGDPLAKVVVFSPHRPTLDQLYLKYKNIYGAGLFAGLDQTYQIEERDKNINSFLRDSSSRVLFCNTSLAVGNNWGIARTAIFIDLPIKLLDFVQSTGRITRRNSKGTSVIIPFIVENTIDTWLWESIVKKQKNNNEIITSDDDGLIEKEEVLEGLKSAKIN